MNRSKDYSGQDDNKNNGSRGNNQSICIDFLPLVRLLFLPPFRMLLMVIVDAPSYYYYYLSPTYKAPSTPAHCARFISMSSSSQPSVQLTSNHYPFIRPSVLCVWSQSACRSRSVSLPSDTSRPVGCCCCDAAAAAPASVLRTVKDSGTCLGENISSPKPPSIRFGNYC